MAEVRARRDESLAKAWLAGCLAWAIPGAGHLWLGRVWRGFMLGGSVWIMFVIGLLIGGHLFSIFSADTGMLSYVFGFCNFGAGLLYIGCAVTDIGFVEQAKRVTAEYGNIFLMVAGLLNYLVMLDAFDIGARRKL